MSEHLNQSFVAKVFYHSRSVASKSYWLLCSLDNHHGFNYYKIIAVLPHLEDFSAVKKAKPSVRRN